jgi:hypothetical protein
LLALKVVARVVTVPELPPLLEPSQLLLSTSLSVAKVRQEAEQPVDSTVVELQGMDITMKVLVVEQPISEQAFSSQTASP